MANSAHISAYWKKFTVVTSEINNPSVAWKTIAKEVRQITAEVPGTPATELEEEVPAIPATYRLNVYPINLNDKGAKKPDIEIGYKLMDYIGQVYDIIALNGLTIDVSDILLSGYCPPSGRPAMVYKESSNPLPPVVPVGETRWVVTSASCLLDGNGINTGQQEVKKKKQKYNTETEAWEDVGETTTDIITNTSACPLPAPDPYRIAHMVGKSYNTLLATEISYSSSVIISSNTASGYNYFYVSTPTVFGKPTIKDDMGSDISYQLVSGGSDNKAGYQPNTVWKLSGLFSTAYKTKFYITL